MRPARTILLLAPDSDENGVIRFVLSKSWDCSQGRAYAVASVETVHAALLAIDHREYDLLLIAHTTRPYESLLKRAKEIRPYMPVLVLTEIPPPKGKRYFDHILYNVSMMTLLERIKVVAAKKRGPKKGSPSWIKGKKLVNGEYVIPNERKAA